MDNPARALHPPDISLCRDSPRGARGRELLGVAAILATFISINLSVATITPTVNVDEPMFCDPAANLYFGKGFTSTMWGQSRTEFWSGNVPLYQGILYLFFKIFGFGFFQARVVNTLLTAAAGLLMWSALARTRFVNTHRFRIACLALVLSGSVSTLTFRTIRYDATMFLLSAIVFFAYSLRRPARLATALLASALMPAAGIPMLPYACVVLAVALFALGRKEIVFLLSIAAGLCAGAAGLFALYSHFSALDGFLRLAFHSTAAGQAKPSWLLTRALGDAQNRDNLLTCFFGNPTEFLDGKVLFDYSAGLLFFVVVLLAERARRTASGSDRRFALATLAIALAVPPTMHLAGHYYSFYRWMTFIPLAVAVPRALEIWHDSTTRLVRGAAWSAICLSVLMGVPARTLAALPNRRESSPAPLEQVAQQVVQPSDVVVCTFNAYFAIRPKASLVYAVGLTSFGDFSQCKDLPTNQITLLCLTPRHFQQATGLIGGKWRKLPLDGIPQAEDLQKTRYAADFYRREAN